MMRLQAVVNLSLLVLATCSLENCTNPTLSSRKNLEIHGTAFGVLDKRRPTIPLGRVLLQLRDEATGNVVGKDSTSRDGSFSFADVHPGKYKICWGGTSWFPDCYKKVVEVLKDSRNIGVIGLVPRTGGGTSMLQGHLELADGSQVGFTDPVLGIDDRPTVRVLQNGVTIAQPEVNNLGDFIIGGLPTGDAVINVRVGTTTSQAPVTSSQIQESALRPIRIIVQNHPPHIVGLKVTNSDGISVSSAKTGTTLTVTALVQDVDSDDLTYRWFTDGASSRVHGEGRTASWTLPDYIGFFQLHLLVFDPKGGYTQDNISLTTGDMVLTGHPSKVYPRELTKLSMEKNDLEIVADATEQPVGASSPEPITQCPQCATGGPFLNRLLGRNASEEAAKKYYDAIDPTKKRVTLGGWWEVNGFTADGSGGISASYLNNNDLGFGRDMHCLQHPSTGSIACYVTNYGSPDQSSRNADLAAAKDEHDRVATVTMEYAPIETQEALGPRVKFFAYLGGVAKSERVPSADLDGAGPKPLPQLCTTCHGGNYNVPSDRVPTADEVALKSSFREFDLASFRFTKNRESNQLTAEELEIFRQLNTIVLGTSPSPGIIELIRGWYDKNPARGPQKQAAFVPVGWRRDSNTSQFYANLVAPSCRTCHIAFGYQARLPDIDWTTYQQFANNAPGIQAVVCGRQKSMPHALITFRNFWQSDRPSILTKFSEPEPDAWDTFGKCQ